VLKNEAGSLNSLPASFYNSYYNNALSYYLKTIQISRDLSGKVRSVDIFNTFRGGKYYPNYNQDKSQHIKGLQNRQKWHAVCNNIMRKINCE